MLNIQKGQYKQAVCMSFLVALSVSFSLDTESNTLNETLINTKKIVIAHRGASGYLPEHTMASKKMAFDMGADYIEQDLVLTKDNKLLVIHDLYLDNVTNVAEVFKDRKREDGHYYVIDFTYDEIKTLKVTERFRIKNNKQVAVFPERSPLWEGDYKLHLFEDEIDVINELNKQHDRSVGIYPEIKSPSFHLKEGKDISLSVLSTLKSYGYDKKSDKVFLQSFDADELKRINDDLLPMLDMDLKLVQLIAKTSWGLTKRYHQGKVTNYSYDWMFEEGAMKKIAQYADGIGPFKRMLISEKSTKKELAISPMYQQARAYGLVIHPYTFRADKGRIEAYSESFEDMLNSFYFTLGVDGVFTDFPDLAVDFLKTKNDKQKNKDVN